MPILTPLASQHLLGTVKGLTPVTPLNGRVMSANNYRADYEPNIGRAEQRRQGRELSSKFLCEK